MNKDSELFDKKIIVTTAENPKSDPAFGELKSDFPPTEDEFVSLWKLYLCSVTARKARDLGIQNEHLESVVYFLKDLSLLEPSLSLNTVLKMVSDYVKRLFRPKEVEGTVHLDPSSGLPSGVSGKIVFSEPSLEARKQGTKPIRQILTQLDTAFKQSGYTVWLLLDRLDVAFAENSETETRALRALFRAYNDMTNLDFIKIKIFIRSDIWDRVTESGFREATHAASPNKSETLRWDMSSLFNVLMRRLLENAIFCENFNLDKAEIVRDLIKQEKLFERIVPDKIDTGNNPKTFGWIFGRLKDGRGEVTPRELIQFMSSLRDVQMKKFEKGIPEPKDEVLFDRASFKEALPSVSENRLQKTIYAEYTELKRSIESLRGRKCRQSVETLARIWSIDGREAALLANRLHKIGIFEQFEWKGLSLYRIPFLYRPALLIVQGSEDGIAIDVPEDDDE